MQISQVPALLQKAFAASGTKNTIPVDSQISVTPGAASLTDGFPPLTMTPLAAGGVPPFGADTNGILNWLSQICQWSNAGGQYLYDATFATAIGGYPKGSTLLKADFSGSWLNLADNNSTDPDNAGTGWTTLGGIALVDTAPSVQVNGTDTIYAKDREQILRWTTIGAFTGYASPRVGEYAWGTQPAVRPWQADLNGQTVDRANPLYTALYYWANASGLFVPAGSWTPTPFVFCEMGGTTFRLPDLRNQLIRATGTNADTANARELGSAQLDALQNITGSIAGIWTNTNATSGAFVGSTVSPSLDRPNGGTGGAMNIAFDASDVARASTETRGPNTAFNPVICL